MPSIRLRPAVPSHTSEVESILARSLTSSHPRAHFYFSPSPPGCRAARHPSQYISRCLHGSPTRVTREDQVIDQCRSMRSRRRHARAAHERRATTQHPPDPAIKSTREKRPLSGVKRYLMPRSGSPSETQGRNVPHLTRTSGAGGPLPPVSPPGNNNKITEGKTWGKHGGSAARGRFYGPRRKFSQGAAQWPHPPVH